VVKLFLIVQGEYKSKPNCIHDGASFARLDNETENIFGYTKRKCCEGSSVLSSRHFPTGEDKVSYSLTPLLSKDYSLGAECQGKLASLS
jgi:hypothetical protein